MPQPCSGSRASVFRMRRSSVPWSKSAGFGMSLTNDTSTIYNRRPRLSTLDRGLSLTRKRIAAYVACVMLGTAVTTAATIAWQIRDIDGVVRDLFRPAGPVGVILFVASDCPVSNGYAPEIQRICDDARTKGGSCTLVYEDSSIDAAGVRTHREEYRYRNIPAVVDHSHAIAQRAKATVTPQAVV